jgi:hypothetical protein
MKFLVRSEWVAVVLTLNAVATPGMMGFALAPLVSFAGGAFLSLKKLI